MRFRHKEKKARQKRRRVNVDGVKKDVNDVTQIVQDMMGYVEYMRLDVCDVDVRKE